MKISNEMFDATCDIVRLHLIDQYRDMYWEDKERGTDQTKELEAIAIVLKCFVSRDQWDAFCREFDRFEPWV